MKIKFSFLLISSLLISNLSAKNFFEEIFNFNNKEERTEGFKQLDLVLNSLSQQILKNNNLEQSKKIVITSVVKLNALNKTTNFGRVVSESLINELYSKRFRIIDVRANKDLSMNKDGQYFLSSDINKISQKHGDVNVLVGTYSKFEYDNVVINLRILNSITGEVLSTANTVYYYDDCTSLDICEENSSVQIVNK